jgi:EAL domain-containing protein (putative c-di-GMP-specific phosphodiesterase class I)
MMNASSSMMQQLPAALLQPGSRVGKSLDTILRAARQYLDMDVAFLTEFLDDDTRIFRQVDSESLRCPVRVGDVLPLSDGYCKRVIDGILPELIPDTAVVPDAMALPATRAVPIGAHLSVPVRLSDGHLYGTFCCFSHQANGALGARDLHMMHTLAALLGHQLDHEKDSIDHSREQADRIKGLIAQGQPRMVYQPIYRLSGDWTIGGVECLARFSGEPARGPDHWFAEAGAVGLGPQLEIAAIRRALTELQDVPGEFYVSINCSPDTAIHPDFLPTLELLAPHRLVVEITEHAHVADYGQLMQSLALVRERGTRIAIDDAGAGYASMRHILSLKPDLIKLDISLTRNIHTDTMRRALAGALVEFARLTGSIIVAEGVETAGELAALHALGIMRAQGYFMSLPLDLPDLVKVLQETPHAE